MRLILTFLLLAVTSLAKGQATDTLKIRFDGFYQDETGTYLEHSGTSFHYLRFYPTGEVISVTSTDTPENLKKWFNLNHDNISTGLYKIKGKNLSFSTTSKNGTVAYKGKIDKPDYLVLKTKSFINRHRGRYEFHFVAVEGLE